MTDQLLFEKDCNPISFIHVWAGRVIFLCIWGSAVDFYLFFFFGVAQSKELIIGMGCEWGNEINAHFELGSFLISYFQTWHCVFTAAGAHCHLSLSRLQIEIDLSDCEPRARRWTLSDAEELPVRCVVTWSFVDCLFILQKTLWCDAGGEMLT